MSLSFRYQLDLSPEERCLNLGAVGERYLADLHGDRFAKYHSHNVRPATLRPVVVDDGGQPRLAVMRWGWDPLWVSSVLTNARWESLSDHPLLRRSYAERRCVVPATGYFDWWRDEQAKPTAKFLFKAHHGGLLRIAGLWTMERTARGPERRFLMLTRHMVLYDQVSHRTPLILTAAAAETWLDPKAQRQDLRTAIAAAETDAHLTVREVPCDAISSRDDGPHLSKPLAEPWPWEGTGGSRVAEWAG